MDAEANECLWLVRNGIPFDVAFSLSDSRRQWMAIKFSEFNGAEYDLDTMTFKE
ncbi:hypothetical protein [Enterobacter ludwigii]|uniref:hypothetical protein n=1 Tax=Enterobacter ludwigii TaxID=299767 RepID=UPI000A68F702|nr:hypothetical protein [Enterobacter ludwigii]